MKTIIVVLVTFLTILCNIEIIKADERRPVVSFYFESIEVRTEPQLKHIKTVTKKTGKKIRKLGTVTKILNVGMAGVLGYTLGDITPEGWKVTRTGVAKVELTKLVLVDETVKVGEIKALVTLNITLNFEGSVGKLNAKPNISIKVSGKGVTKKDVKRFKTLVGQEVKRMIDKINPVKLTEKEEGDIIGSYYLKKEGAKIKRESMFFDKKHTFIMRISARKQTNRPLGEDNPF